MYNCNQTK